MSKLPFDAELVKLRIYRDRKLPAVEDAKRKEEIAQRERYQAQREWDALHLTYLARARELGFCGQCENVLKECTCTIMASPLSLSPAMS